MANVDKIFVAQTLKDNLSFLITSCREYDQGKISEALRMASHVRTIVHDTKSSHSILKQLAIKKKFEWVDYSHDYNPANLMTHLGAVAIQQKSLGNGQIEGSFVPHITAGFTQNRKLVRFDDWWTKLLLKDKNGTRLQRNELVLALANKFGGSHVDPKIDSALYKLVQTNTSGWSVIVNGVEQNFANNLAYACMRQISHEILESLSLAPQVVAYGISIVPPS